MMLGLGRLAAADESMPLSIAWEKNFLTISGPRVPGGAVRIHYLEAYCRPGSTDRDWKETVIKHQSEQLSAAPDAGQIELRDTLADGVTVAHVITARDGEVEFNLTAHNPTSRASDAHWAQPCIRLDKFTGRDKTDYLSSCFIFLDGKLARLPTEPWATTARYVPGQVYCPRQVDRRDVNPRPLSPLVPSRGLCGAFSADGKFVLATAWEPYQELFQGVLTCLHSDFRIAGLLPGETKHIRGKIYIVPADVPALVARYERDFPEQTQRRP
ncbi:MAG TPA: hypothetical protein VHY20_01475 [Pirellulales bacterium]|nr:hypothetical protein [Pirellulales bacterium]